MAQTSKEIKKGNSIAILVSLGIITVLLILYFYL